MSHLITAVYCLVGLDAGRQELFRGVKKWQTADVVCVSFYLPTSDLDNFWIASWNILENYGMIFIPNTNKNKTLEETIYEEGVK